MTLRSHRWDGGAPPSRASEPAALMDLWFHTAGAVSGEMVIQMELALAGTLDAARLDRACTRLVHEHPVLASRLVVEDDAAHWQRLPETPLVHARVVEDDAAFERARALGRDAIGEGQLAVWRRPARGGAESRQESQVSVEREARTAPETDVRAADAHGDRLLVTMTHAVGDGVGLQSLVARLAALYASDAGDRDARGSAVSDAAARAMPAAGAGGATTHRAAVPPAAVTSRDLDMARLREPVGRRWRAMTAFARFILPRRFPLATHRLGAELRSEGGWSPVVARLPRGSVTALAAYARARGGTLNDVLLAAVYRAHARVGGWDGREGLRVAITVDLRRWCLPEGARPALRNLSSLDCPYLGRRLGARFDDTLAHVAALTAARKRAWPGLALALAGQRLMARAGAACLEREATTRAPSRADGCRPVGIWARASAVLSNEGPLDAAPLRFGETAVPSAHILPPFLALPGLHLCASSFDGTLTLAAVTAENGRPLVERLLDATVEELPLDA